MYSSKASLGYGAQKKGNGSNYHYDLINPHQYY